MRAIILPLKDGGENSEIYRGQIIEATQMPSPRMGGKPMRTVALPASIQPMAERKNNPAESSMIFLRPYTSLSFPESATPIMQPSRAELTNQPSIRALK